MKLEMSRDSLRQEVLLLGAGLTSLEERARGRAPGTDDALEESLEELRTTIESLRAADDALRAEAAARRALQAKLAIQGKRYRDLFELAPDCGLVTDRRATIRAANVEAGRLLNVAANFLAGKPLAIYVPLDERRRFRGEFAEVVEGGPTSTWEGHVQPRGGAPIDVAFTASAIREAGGRIEGLQWVVRDITARKRAEADALALRLDLERRVVERTAELEEANRLAREGIRARDSLLSIISHDLKHPLTVIKGYTQLLQQAARRGSAMSPERLAETIDKMEAATDRLTAQIDEILDVTRAQLGRAPELRRQPVDLVALARRVVTEYQQASPRHRLALQSGEPAPICPGDPARLGRVLDNLLSNAVKFSPDGGDVVVRVGRELGERGDQIVVEVADHGIGIPPAELSHVFELFYRVPRAEGNIVGAGVGLASAQQIVELHGGTIDVTSQVGVGTTFVVRLPVAI